MMSFQQIQKTRHLPGCALKDRRLAPQSTMLALFAVLMAQPVAALERIDDFGDNPGELHMFLHRPAAFTENLPLVVALHGCQQTAADFDDETGLTALAEETPFLLLLPEQDEQNMARRCFRWYDREDNQRAGGESASILAMIDKLIEEEGVDPTRVHILGLSAGGAMTAVMLSNYPERFAGGAIFAGLPYGCNRPAGFYDFTWNWLHYSPFAVDGADASYACGIAGFQSRNHDAENWAELVRQSAGGLLKHWPRVSLWQGSGDTTVDPDNLEELTEQWTRVQGIDAVADDEQVLGDATRKLYLDDSGDLRVETWELDGFGHAVPIDTQDDAEPCGVEGGYVQEAGVCAVRRVGEFWGL